MENVAILERKANPRSNCDLFPEIGQNCDCDDQFWIIDQGNQNVMTDSMSSNDPPVLVAPPAQLDLPFDDSDNRPVGEEVEVFPEMKIRGTYLNSDAHTPTYLLNIQKLHGQTKHVKNP
nr:hypothetical protein Iba_chr15aCG13660 [Ipomoea batatas]